MNNTSPSCIPLYRASSGLVAAGALGTTVKSPSLLAAQGLASGDFDPALIRMERFGLQSVVRDILPASPTAKCLRLRRRSEDGEAMGVSIWRAAESHTAHYKGLQTCASVWACPVCSAKISEKRRLEVAAAIAAHNADGGEVLLLTLTNRHHERDDLGNLVRGQLKALQYFMRGSKAAKKWFDSLGSIGTIRAFEITHQEANGWHPHFHILVFAKQGLDLAHLTNTGFDLWAQCCKLAKLKEPTRERGLRLENGDRAAKYVGSWGLDYEVTKGHQKKAKTGGSSPFDLLRRVLADAKDGRARQLFAEFARVFKGRRQLVWSRGLKARFAVEEKTDGDLAEGVVSGSELFARLSTVQWRAVLRRDQSWGISIRGQLLELAGKNDRLRFDLLLDALAMKPHPSRDRGINRAVLPPGLCRESPCTASIPEGNALGVGSGVAPPPIPYRH